MLLNIPATINSQMETFLSFMRDVKKSSSNTLQAYVRDLDRFSAFCSAIGLNSFTEVEKDHVNDYKEYMHEQGFSTSSVSRALSAVRSLLQHLITLGEMESNPAREIHNDKTYKKIPIVLTNDEVDRLLSQPSGKDAKGIRDRAMLELLYATGIKASELIEMNINDVNIQLSIVKCTKGGKERIIPLYPLAVKHLADYINGARKLLVLTPDESALFVNVSGERMTRQGLWKILKTYASEAKILNEITPHTLRHSFAAHLLQNGADIHEIQEILGHSDISSTQRYAQCLKMYHKRSYVKYHPRA